MIDLKPYTAKGFPGNWDKSLAEILVKGIDRIQAQSMVRLCRQTEPALYGPDFSPTKIRYQAGSRPALERIVATLPGRGAQEKATAAMSWVIRHVDHPHFAGMTAPDRALSEEDLIASGRGWCNEQTRVFIALCEVMEIPARLCFLFHANGVCGHTAAEVHLRGRWAFFDVTFGVTVTRPDGLPAEGRELSGPLRQLAHKAYRPAIEDYGKRVLPYVDEVPGWGRAHRPSVDRGGDLLDLLGICNYLIQGVEPVRSR